MLSGVYHSLRCHQSSSFLQGLNQIDVHPGRSCFATLWGDTADVSVQTRSSFQSLHKTSTWSDGPDGENRKAQDRKQEVLQQPELSISQTSHNNLSWSEQSCLGARGPVQRSSATNQAQVLGDWSLLFPTQISGLCTANTEGTWRLLLLFKVFGKYMSSKWCMYYFKESTANVVSLLWSVSKDSLIANEGKENYTMREEKRFKWSRCLLRPFTSNLWFR